MSGKCLNIKHIKLPVARTDDISLWTEKMLHSGLLVHLIIESRLLARLFGNKLFILCVGRCYVFLWIKVVQQMLSLICDAKVKKRALGVHFSIIINATSNKQSESSRRTFKSIFSQTIKGFAIYVTFTVPLAVACSSILFATPQHLLWENHHLFARSAFQISDASDSTKMRH